VEERWRRSLAAFYDELGVDGASAAAGPARAPFSDDMADALEPFRPPVVSFHFGLPAPALLARVRGWGSRVVSSATTVEEARWLEAHGADVVIAQGVEAGGHRGTFLAGGDAQLPTLELLRAVRGAVSVPVVAAGGIADAAGVRAAMAAGAAGVQVGTAFLLAPEAATTALHRAALAAERRETAITNVFTGRPARGIVNRLVREVGPRSPLAPPFPLAAAAVAPLRAAAERMGSSDFSPLWCGEFAGRYRALPAAQLTRELGAAALG
jgi:nitronate monooxygenase